ncbi:Major facilitator superfamily like protein [Aduncisulcus paluster]|uniref:Major facilitator superfamily like protein n=1 Tax=Aduncisulcus paluster TaxID=2918883 RepID=A0ABQ5JZR9_9EUKA|nr:Major facilitator superfamily like protein [Aduncisulcus paluster]
MWIFYFIPDKTADSTEIIQKSSNESNVRSQRSESKVKNIGDASRVFYVDRNLKPGVLVLLLGFAVMLCPLDLQLVTLVNPTISEQFDKDTASTQWVAQFFAIVQASLLLMGGKLVDAVGPCTMLKLGLRIFIVGDLISFLSQSFVMLLVSRAIAAVGIAFLTACPAAIMGRKVVKGKLPIALALNSICFAAAKEIAPLLGGRMATKSYSTCFIIGPVCASIAYMSVRTFLRDHMGAKKKRELKEKQRSENDRIELERIKKGGIVKVEAPTSADAPQEAGQSDSMPKKGGWDDLDDAPVENVKPQRAPVVKKEQRKPFDIPGVGLMAVIISCLVLAFSSVSMDSLPSWLFFVFIGIDIVAVFVFIQVEKRAPDPLLPLKIFNSRFIVFPIICSVITYSSLYIAGYLMSYVLLMPKYYNYDTEKLGKFMMPTPFAMMIASITASQLTKKVVTRVCCAAGLITLSVSLLLIALGIYLENTGVMLVGMILEYAGVGLYNVPAQTFIISSTPTHFVGVASALIQVTTAFGNSFGVALSAFIHKFYVNLLFDGAKTDPGYQDAYLAGAQWTYVTAAVFPVLCVIVIWKIGVLPRERGRRGFSEQGIDRAACEKAKHDGVPGFGGLGGLQEIRGRTRSRAMSSMRVLVTQGDGKGKDELKSMKDISHDKEVEIQSTVGVRVDADDVF